MICVTMHCDVIRNQKWHTVPHLEIACYLWLSSLFIVPFPLSGGAVPRIVELFGFLGYRRSFWFWKYMGFIKLCNHKGSPLGWKLVFSCTNKQIVGENAKQYNFCTKLLNSASAKHICCLHSVILQHKIFALLAFSQLRFVHQTCKFHSDKLL